MRAQRTFSNVKCKRMNILLLCREFPPAHHGGIGTFYQELAKEFGERGHSVNIIAEGYNDLRVDRRMYFTLYRVNQVPRRFSKSQFISFLLYNRLMYNSLATLLKKTKIDIVESSSYGGEAFFYCARKTLPLIIRLHGLISLDALTKHLQRPSLMADMRFPDVSLLEKLSSKYKHIDSCFCRILEKRSIDSADLIISPSEAYKKLTCNLMGLDTSRINVVYHGIAPVKPRVDPVPLKWFKGSFNKENSKIVLFVGRVTFEKGAHVLIRAIPDILKENPETKFVFCGIVDKKVLSFFRKHLKKSEREKVLFTGRLKRRQVFYLYQVCDIFCHPSLYETFAIVLLEAMIFEKPIVASNIGAIPEIVKDNHTGFLVPPNDSKVLADSIITLLNDEELRSSFGRKGAERVRMKFSIEDTAKKSIELYENVI